MGLNNNKTTLQETDNVFEEEIKKKLVNNNKNWIICILVAIVLVLIAIVIASQLFDKKNVSLIISYTTSILSIVLSLLAILYSYHGNVESSRNLSEIRSAVAEIRATEDAIKSIIQMIDMGVSNVNTNMSIIGNQIANSLSTSTNHINNAYHEPGGGEIGIMETKEQKDKDDGANTIADGTKKETDTLV